MALQRQSVRAIIGWVLIGAAVAVLLFVTVSPASNACFGCHDSQRRALGESGHAAVASCYDCHLANGLWSWPGQKIREVFVMAPRQVFGADLPSLAQVSAGACLDCHEDIYNATTSARGLRIAHDPCARGVSCDECHATVAHGESSGRRASYTMDACTACHAAEKATLECASCHPEGTENAERSDGPWQVTHGANWEKTHGMGDLQSCRVCHSDGYCVRCHVVDVPHPGSFGKEHGPTYVRSPDSCRTCHDQTRFCDPCHGMKMPHPASFAREHGTEAVSMTDERCKRCHMMSDCVKCHESHIHPGGAAESAADAGVGR